MFVSGRVLTHCFFLQFLLFSFILSQKVDREMNKVNASDKPTHQFTRDGTRQMRE